MFDILIKMNEILLQTNNALNETIISLREQRDIAINQYNAVVAQNKSLQSELRELKNKEVKQ